MDNEPQQLSSIYFGSVLCVTELFESLSNLFLIMADASEPRLVPNCCGGMFLDKKAAVMLCGHCNLDVTSEFKQNDYIESCSVD
ncbi:hypothetical protein T4E_939 [Trichinella pseudospiralis]|uniref:Uncharacterized protein n=1 Tax=Trichinella pseudospiralis TaxID=6337 RepID=A0A0V0XIS9_TRIPS|nr:hypothetical protein T4E_939 [Trichinella pseudospiralis]